MPDSVLPKTWEVGGSVEMASYYVVQAGLEL